MFPPLASTGGGGGVRRICIPWWVRRLQTCILGSQGEYLGGLPKQVLEVGSGSEATTDAFWLGCAGEQSASGKRLGSCCFKT